MRISRKILALAETAAFLAGGAVFWRLLHASGFAALREAWDAAGPRLAEVFALYPLMTLWDTASWRNLFGKPRPRFFPLFWIRMAGEAVNNVTPGLDIGGEPLKIRWASERLGIPAEKAASATIAGKTSLLVSEVFFLWTGAALGWSAFAWPAGSREAFVLAAAVITGVVASLVLFQRTKLFGSWSPGTREFYGRFMPRFSGSVLLNLGGWLSGAAELWAFAWILGIPLEWRHALVFESFVQLVRTASFFIPGNVGTQEAGYVFLVGLAGHDPSFGMALSLLKRARQLVWTAIGFGIWGAFHCDRVSRQPAGNTAPAVLDSFLDRVIHRPPARALAGVLAKTPVTPNAVTFLSLVPAFAAAYFLANSQVWSAALGLLGFYAWSVLDHADGELARRQGRQSAFGRVLDDGCDVVASTVMLVGLWYGLSSYWNMHDRLILDRLFYSALVFNTIAAILALALRRDSGVSECARGVLDSLTGREPFYLCLVMLVLAEATGHPYLYAFLGGFLVLGQCVLFLITLAAFLRRIRTA